MILPGCFAGTYHRETRKLPLARDKVPIEHRMYLESAGNDEIRPGKFAGFAFNPKRLDAACPHRSREMLLLNSQSRSRFAVYEQFAVQSGL